LRCDVQTLNEQVVQKQSVVDKPEKCHVSRPRKVAVAILFPLEKMRNLLRMGSSKRGEDYHLQRMMGSGQRR
jgi:hypothetical protein